MLKRVQHDGRGRKAVGLLMLLAVAACATLSPRQQVRERLLAAGLKPAFADCLADKLARDLSVHQLRVLGRAAQGAVPAPGHHVHFEVVLQRIASIDDPRIVAVTSRAAVGCAIAG